MAFTIGTIIKTMVKINAGSVHRAINNLGFFTTLVHLFKFKVFNPITSVMNDEMTVEEWAQNVEDAFAQVRADMEAAN